jgi:hypothetical protein
MVLLELRSPWFIGTTDWLDAWSQISFLDVLHLEEVVFGDKSLKCSSECSKDFRAVGVETLEE